MKSFHKEKSPPRKITKPTDSHYDSSSRLNFLFTTHFNGICLSNDSVVKYYSDYYFGFIFENKR